MSQASELIQEVYFQLTQRTECVLSWMASLVNKHANLVRVIKTKCANGDDPGLK